MNARAESPRPPRAATLLCLAAAALAGCAAPAAALARGEAVRLSGAVADPAGRPIAGLAVTLTATRSYFSLRKMQSAEASPRTVSTRTDAAGRYALEWPGDDYHNRFELAVGIPWQGARGDEVEVLERRDVSSRMTGGAVAVPFTVQDAAYVEKVRSFLAGLASDDERRVFGQLGHPDEVRRVVYPDHDEVSWWYFESGKAYRFEGGRLAQVIPFDPVKPF